MASLLHFHWTMQAQLPVTKSSPILTAIATLLGSVPQQSASSDAGADAFRELVSQMSGCVAAKLDVSPQKPRVKREAEKADVETPHVAGPSDLTRTVAAAVPTPREADPTRLSLEQTDPSSVPLNADAKVVAQDADLVPATMTVPEAEGSEEQKSEGAEQDLIPTEVAAVTTKGSPLPSIGGVKTWNERSENAAHQPVRPMAEIHREVESSPIVVASPMPKGRHQSKNPEPKAVAHKAQATESHEASGESEHKTKIDDHREHSDKREKQSFRDIDSSSPSIEAAIKSPVTGEVSAEVVRPAQQVPSPSIHADVSPSRNLPNDHSNTAATNAPIVQTAERTPFSPIPQIQSAELLRHGDKAELKVELRTPELGHVQVSAALRDEVVHATVKVESSEVREFITSEIGRNETPLAAHDLKVQAFDASCSTNNGSSPSRQEHAYQAPQRAVLIRSEWSESARTVTSGSVANLRDDRAVDLLA